MTGPTRRRETASTTISDPRSILPFPERGSVMLGLPAACRRSLLVLFAVAISSAGLAARGQDLGVREVEPEVPKPDAPVMAVQRGGTREAWEARLSAEIA